MVCVTQQRGCNHYRWGTRYHKRRGCWPGHPVSQWLAAHLLPALLHGRWVSDPQELALAVQESVQGFQELGAVVWLDAGALATRAVVAPGIIQHNACPCDLVSDEGELGVHDGLNVSWLGIWRQVPVFEGGGFTASLTGLAAGFYSAGVVEWYEVSVW